MPSRYINNNINYIISLDLVYYKARYKIIFFNNKISGLKTIRVIIDINIRARIQNLVINYIIVNNSINKIIK